MIERCLVIARVDEEEDVSSLHVRAVAVGLLADVSLDLRPDIGVHESIEGRNPLAVDLDVELQHLRHFYRRRRLRGSSRLVASGEEQERSHRSDSRVHAGRGLHPACRKDPGLYRAESRILSDCHTAILRRSRIVLQPLEGVTRNGQMIPALAARWTSTRSRARTPCERALVLVRRFPRARRGKTNTRSRARRHGASAAARSRRADPGWPPPRPWELRRPLATRTQRDPLVRVAQARR